MTLEQAVELGRRMMACEGFEWRAGMVALRHGAGSSLLVGDVHLMEGWQPALAYVNGRAVSALCDAAEFTPDPRDPGTVGHALAMMRALADGAGTGIPHCVPNPQNRYELSTRPAWGVMACGTPLGLGDSEAEAIVNAWEVMS